MPELHNPLHLRVYWEDTDAGGVVYYANYLKFFERARTEWLRGLGVEQSTLQEQTGCIFVVAEAQIRYLASARLDDCLSISVEVLKISGASLECAQQAWRDTTLLAEGRVRIGCIAANTLRPCRIPASIRQRIAVV